MLTYKDIELLKTVFPTREEVSFDMEELRSDFRNLQTSVDNYAKKVDVALSELIVLNHRVTRLEEK